MNTTHINTLIVMTRRALEKAAFTVDEMPAIYEAIKAAEQSIQAAQAQPAMTAEVTPEKGKK